MALFKIIFGLLGLAHQASAVYEDEAGMQEFVLPNVGPPCYAHFAGHHRMYVASYAGVAALAVSDGSIVWRHVGSGAAKDLTVVQKVVAVSVGDSVRAFRPSNGEYMWELRGTALQQLTSFSRAASDELLIVRKNQLQLVGASGSPLVTVEASSIDENLEFYRGFPAGADIGILCRKEGSTSAFITKVDQNGEVVLSPKELAYIPDHIDIFQKENLRLVGSTLVIIKDTVVHSVSLTAMGSWSTTHLQGSDYSFQGKAIGNTVTVSNGESTSILRADDGILTVSKTVSSRVAVGAVTRDSKLSGDEVALTTISASGLNVDLLASGSENAPFAKNSAITKAKNGYPFVTAVAISKKQQKVLVVSSDFNVALLDVDASGGTVTWSRREAWSTVQSAVMWQALPDSVAAIAEGHSVPTVFSMMADPASAALEFQLIAETVHDRVQSIFDAIQNKFLGTLTTVPMKIRTEELFQSIGAHKLAIASTCSGSIVAMDTVTRNVQWDVFLPVSYEDMEKCVAQALAPSTRFTPKFALSDDSPVSLFLNPEPTGAVSESKAKLVVFHRSSGKIYWLEPSTGAIIHEEKFSKGSKKILRVSPVSKKFGSESGVAPVMVTTDDQTTYLVPSAVITDEMYASLEGMHSFEVKKDISEVVGFARASGTDAVSMLPIWNVNFGKEKIVAVTTVEHGNRDNFPVHVRGDASVLYKFINRNLLTVVTERAEAGELVTHLIDSVTGRLIHRSTIRGTTPVYVASCDNWAAVHYWSEDNTRFEMSVTELFKSQPDEGPWNIVFGASGNSTMSAYNMETPIALEKSFIIAQGITALGVTNTAKGITPRAIIMATRSNQVAILHKDILNARRPIPDNLKKALVGVEYTKIPPQFASTADEQIQPYSPMVVIPPTQVVSLTNQVVATRGIVSSPTKLESSSLVFSYGLDCFFAVVQPSNAFDTLPPGFNYPTMYVSVIGVFAALIFTTKMAARKELKERWA